MKTAVIISDTHGRKIDDLRDVIKSADYLLFAGDGYYDLYRTLSDDEKAKFIGVVGNCDRDVNANIVSVFNVENVRIFMTHGHMHGARYHNMGIWDAAREQNCDMAIYGHTHSEQNTIVNGMVIFNPGSYGYDRSYGILTVDGSKFFVKNLKI